MTSTTFGDQTTRGVAPVANSGKPDRDAFTLKHALDWLEADRRPRMVIDEDELILWSNNAAKCFSRCGLPIVVRGDRLMVVNAALKAKVRRFFAEATFGVQRLVVTCIDDCDDLLIIGASASGEGRQRRVFVKLTLPQPTLAAEASGLALQYGLTHAEAGVLEALVSLKTPTVIARCNGISVHTVRTHVRRIYSKMGVHDHAHLMRMAIAFCGA